MFVKLPTCLLFKSSMAESFLSFGLMPCVEAAEVKDFSELVPDRFSRLFDQTYQYLTCQHPKPYTLSPKP